MPVARRPDNHLRVIAHVDLDCFYVQVEQRRHHELRGKPTAVIQYNPWKGGACIAVGYEARKCGVKRSMRGDDAKAVCPDINLIQVPVAHEKADLTIYRDAGSEVVAVLSRVGKCERASIDEVYLDITEAAEILASHGLPEPISEEARKTHVLGIPEDYEVGEWLCRTDASRNDRLLTCGAIIIADIRLAVLAETEFTCSAGIAHNKMLAKLASGMHKPAQQTLIPSSAVEGLLANLPITKIGQLGGKLGQALEADFGVKTAGDLLQFSEAKLQDLYGINTGTWLWNIARGINGDEVQDRTLPKSHSSGKTFPGPRALKNLDSAEYWIKELATTLQERLEIDLTQNNRMAHLLTIHASSHIGGRAATSKFPSRSCALRYGIEKITEDAFCLFERGLRDFCMSHGLSPGKKGSDSINSWVVTGLSLTASNIFAKPTGVNPITQYFGASCSDAETAGASSPDRLNPQHSHTLEMTDVVESTSEQNVITGNSVENQSEAGTYDLEAVAENSQNIDRLAEDRHGHASMNEASKAESTLGSTKKSLKLKDLWERKGSDRPRNHGSAVWEYRQEDIDEDVLAELPKEIQLELQNRLGIKRPRRTNPSTITDLFKSRLNSAENTDNRE